MTAREPSRGYRQQAVAQFQTALDIPDKKVFKKNSCCRSIRIVFNLA